MAAVDIPRMAESYLFSESLDEQNLLILQAYAERSAAAKASDSEYSGWLDRMEPSEEVTDEELTRIHGELIARGMVRFQLISPRTGLQYQLSDLGRDILKRQTVVFPSSSAAEQDEPASEEVTGDSKARDEILQDAA